MLKEQEITGTIKSKINNPGQFFKNTLSGPPAGPTVGWFCTYTPEELIIAAGFTPVRIFGRKKISKSESYFPINFCPYIKAGWESLLSDNHSFKGLVFANSCDGMRRFYDVARIYLKDTPSYLLDVPHLKSSNSIDFFTANTGELKAFLEKLGGSKITTRKIEKAIITTGKKRALLKELNGFIKKFPHILNISTYFKIMELAFLSEPEIFSEELEKYIKFINIYTVSDKTASSADYKEYPPIMIIGNFIAEKKLWELLSTMNITLACDDLCTSGRYFENRIDPDNHRDLLKAIAESYLSKPPCMRMANLGFKLAEIKDNITGNDIRGVLFISLKFCDTMLYSFSILKKKLNEMGIPALYLEIEYNNFSEGQIKTRVQAFLEML